jgi:hypothetical protein
VTIPSDARRTVDAGRLWIGGVATAVVCVMTGVTIGALLSGVSRSAIQWR